MASGILRFSAAQAGAGGRPALWRIFPCRASRVCRRFLFQPSRRESVRTHRTALRIRRISRRRAKENRPISPPAFLSACLPAVPPSSHHAGDAKPKAPPFSKEMSVFAVAFPEHFISPESGLSQPHLPDMQMGARPILSFSLKRPLGGIRAPSSEAAFPPGVDMKAYEALPLSSIAAAISTGLNSLRE